MWIRKTYIAVFSDSPLLAIGGLLTSAVFKFRFSYSTPNTFSTLITVCQGLSASLNNDSTNSRTIVSAFLFIIFDLQYFYCDFDPGRTVKPTTCSLRRIVHRQPETRASIMHCNVRFRIQYGSAIRGSGSNNMLRCYKLWWPQWFSLISRTFYPLLSPVYITDEYWLTPAVTSCSFVTYEANRNYVVNAKCI